MRTQCNKLANVFTIELYRGLGCMRDALGDLKKYSSPNLARQFVPMAMEANVQV